MSLECKLARFPSSLHSNCSPKHLRAFSIFCSRLCNISNIHPDLLFDHCAHRRDVQIHRPTRFAPNSIFPFAICHLPFAPLASLALCRCPCDARARANNERRSGMVGRARPIAVPQLPTDRKAIQHPLLSRPPSRLKYLYWPVYNRSIWRSAARIAASLATRVTTRRRSLCVFFVLLFHGGVSRAIFHCRIGSPQARRGASIIAFLQFCIADSTFLRDSPQNGDCPRWAIMLHRTLQIKHSGLAGRFDGL